MCFYVFDMYVMFVSFARDLLISFLIFGRKQESKKKQVWLLSHDQ